MLTFSCTVKKCHEVKSCLSQLLQLSSLSYNRFHTNPGIGNPAAVITNPPKSWQMKITVK